MKARALALVLALIVRLLAACGSEESAEPKMPLLRIGVLPDQSAEVLRARYTPLVEHLAQELEVPYELVPSESYADLVAQFAAGRVDLAYFGGLTFLQARRAAGAVPLVMRDVDERFTSYFLVHAENAATDIADFEGKRLCFGSRISTSGHLMPRDFLAKRGVDPNQFFAEVCYSGAHDQTAYNVRDGRADLGVANANIVRAMLADGRLRENDVRILWETPPYLDYVWAVRPAVDPAVRQNLREAFLMLSTLDEDHARILDLVGADGFLPARADDFLALEKIAQRVGLLGDDDRLAEVRGRP